MHWVSNNILLLWRHGCRVAAGIDAMGGDRWTRMEGHLPAFVIVADLGLRDADKKQVIIESIFSHAPEIACSLEAKCIANEFIKILGQHFGDMADGYELCSLVRAVVGIGIRLFASAAYVGVSSLGASLLQCLSYSSLCELRVDAMRRNFGWRRGMHGLMLLHARGTQSDTAAPCWRS